MKALRLLLLSLLLAGTATAQNIPRPTIGPVIISSLQPTILPLTIAAAAGQTAHMQDWNAGGGAIEAYIDAAGTFHGGIALPSGLAPNRLLYVAASGDISAALGAFYDSLNNRIGLFTTSPVSPFHVNAYSTFSDRVVIQDQGVSTLLVQGQELVGSFGLGGHPVATYGVLSAYGYSTVASTSDKKNILFFLSDSSTSKERIGTTRADTTVSYWPLTLETATNEVLNLTIDPFVQLTTSYAGGNLSAAGTAALRNNVGALQASQNGGAWSTVLTAATAVTSITGTANQIIASSPTGAVTLSTPQNIGTGSTPTFASVTVNDVAYSGAWNGSNLVPTRNAVYDEMETRAVKSGVTAHTIMLAPITGGGTPGSITWNSDGVITAYVDPT